MKTITVEPKQIEPFSLDKNFNEFLKALKVLFKNSSLERVQDILSYIDPESSLFKTKYNKYLQSIFSFLNLHDKHKEYEIRKIFTEYFKNNNVDEDEIRSWFHIYHINNPEARVILYEQDEPNYSYYSQKRYRR